LERDGPEEGQNGLRGKVPARGGPSIILMIKRGPFGGRGIRRRRGGQRSTAFLDRRGGREIGGEVL